jgi:hypothetical protein
VRQAGTLWTQGQADRRVRLELRLRRHLDQMVARALHPGVSLLIAPTLGAHASFARARALGVRCLLIQDLPDLRDLHRDLDLAAVAHPDAPLLRRYRAPDVAVVRQAQERVLADAHAVNHPNAPGEGPRFPLPGAPVVAEPAGGDAVLLSGLPVARNGSIETLQAMAGRPLQVRVGETCEPADLMQRPGVTAATDLRGIGVVAAPAWIESHHPVLVRAAASGIPVVATQRAAGWIDLDLHGARVDPGDAAGLARAIASVMGQRRPEWTPPPSGLAAWCAG